MEQESRGDFSYNLKDIARYVISMVKGAWKPDLKEESELPNSGEDSALLKELQDKIKEVDTREKTVRVGEIEAKVLGRKKSFNKKPTFSQEKSLRVENVKVKKGSVLGENIHEKKMTNEGIERE